MTLGSGSEGKTKSFDVHEANITVKAKEAVCVRVNGSMLAI